MIGGVVEGVVEVVVEDVVTVEDGVVGEVTEVVPHN